jgi:hypothetical protein
MTHRLLPSGIFFCGSEGLPESFSWDPLFSFRFCILYPEYPLICQGVWLVKVFLLKEREREIEEAEKVDTYYRH